MIIEKLLGAATMCALVTIMAAIDEKFGEFMSGLMRGELSSDVLFLSNRAVSFTRTVTDTLGTYTSDNFALVGFGVGALVLLGLMFRS
jgi:hypothetical protein